MDSTAIKEIQNGAIALELGKRVNDTEVPVAVIPKDFNVHSLERYQEFRSRLRASLNTSHIDSFVGYIGAQRADDGDPIFVDPDDVSAKVIFDLGDEQTPGHCDHTAILKLRKTAAFEAYEDLFERIGRGGIGQRALAEWVEDWRSCIFAYGEEDSEIDVKRLIATIRRVSIEGIRKADSSEENYSSSRTTLEEITAKSEAGELPEWLEFVTEPYHGLPQQKFRFRISIRTGGDQLSFGAFRIQEGRDAEVIGENFIAELKQHLPEATLYQGVFSAGE